MPSVTFFIGLNLVITTLLFTGTIISTYENRQNIKTAQMQIKTNEDNMTSYRIRTENLESEVAKLLDKINSVSDLYDIKQESDSTQISEIQSEVSSLYTKIKNIKTETNDMKKNLDSLPIKVKDNKDGTKTVQIDSVESKRLIITASYKDYPYILLTTVPHPDGTLYPNLSLFQPEPSQQNGVDMSIMPDSGALTIHGFKLLGTRDGILFPSSHTTLCVKQNGFVDFEECKDSIE